MGPPVTYGKRGKILHAQAREIVANVIKFMKDEANHKLLGTPVIPLQNFEYRTLMATQISESTFRYITKECRTETIPGTSGSTANKRTLEVAQISENTDKRIKKDGGDVEANPETKPHKNKPPINLSTLLITEAEKIRQLVHDFYITEKQKPSLKGILKKIQDSGIRFEGSLVTLHKLLFKLGFKWQKTIHKKKVLMESHEVRRKRIEYLRAISKYRAEGRNLVFTDETYLHSSDMQPKEGADGNRLLLIGNARCDIPSVLLIFTSVSKTGDCYDRINHENFMQGVNSQVLPDLPPKSILILDSASYYNVAVEKDPTISSKRKEMIEWLQRKNIPFEDDLTKPELYNIIKMHKPLHKVYKFDLILQEHGHDVLRLPPCHPELNPIGKVWGITKDWVAARSATFNLADVEQLAKTKFEEISADDWATICQRCKKLEEEYIAKEYVLDNALEFKFTVNTDSSDDDFDLSDAENEGGNR